MIEIKCFNNMIKWLYFHLIQKVNIINRFNHNMVTYMWSYVLMIKCFHLIILWLIRSKQNDVIIIWLNEILIWLKTTIINHILRSYFIIILLQYFIFSLYLKWSHFKIQNFEKFIKNSLHIMIRYEQNMIKL